MRPTPPVLASLALVSCMTVPTAQPAASPLDDAGGSVDAGTTLVAPSAPTFDASFSVPSAPTDSGVDAGSRVLVLDATPPSAPADAAVTDTGGPSADSGAPTGDAAVATFDGGPPLPDGACRDGLAPASLAIDELMIESVSGAGDYGEWVEVANTAGCLLNLNGLHAETPRGAMVTTLDILTDVWLPPNGFFLIADSENTSINHNVPGLVFEWFGGKGDTLRNQGSTVTLSAGGLLIDTVTYPSLKLTPGVSIEFPSVCSPTARAVFANWGPAAASWFPGFSGTPNSANSDIACP